MDTKKKKCISVIPSYLILVAVMIIVGVILASILVNVYTPLSLQTAYLGRAISYSYRVYSDKVTIRLANTKNYESKADVALVLNNNTVLTACRGTMLSSEGRPLSGISNSTIQLLGISLRPREILTITCYEKDVKTVRVFEYGVPSSVLAEARRGIIRGYYYSSGGKIDIGTLLKDRKLYFRIPVTVVSPQNYTNVEINVIISSDTVPPDILGFFRTHTRPDMNDVLVVDTDNHPYPTQAERVSQTYFIIKFYVDKLPAGVKRFYIMFGNPDIDSPIYPIPSDANISRTTLPWIPSDKSLIRYEPVAIPAYMYPETNWVPVNDEIKYGILEFKNKNTFDYYLDILKNGDPAEVKNMIIEPALRNKKPFPIGTGNAWKRYKDYKTPYKLVPKTDLGLVPWATITVVELPKIENIIPTGTTVTTKLLVSSDDGSGAYLLVYAGDKFDRKKYYDDVYNRHGPKYWNYKDMTLSLSADEAQSEKYLVIPQQNGICGCIGWWCPCGSGPGFLDFRYIIWWVEQLYNNAPSSGDFGYVGYIDVTVHGIGEDLYGYAYPVDITGREDVDWSIFRTDTVYVVSLTERNQPLYYWPQVEGGKVIIWVKIPKLPANGAYSFRIWYGGKNKYPQYNNPEKVFEFFDDFRKDPQSSGKWDIHGRKVIWDKDSNVVYLIKNENNAGTQMYMKNIDWKKNFHVHFKAYISGEADGMAFFFFKKKNPSPFVTWGNTLGLYYCEYVGTIVPVCRYRALPGYAVVFDIYENRGQDPKTPYVGLSVTNDWPPILAEHKHVNVVNKVFDVDVYYYKGKLVVKINGDPVITHPSSPYAASVFSLYGIQYGGMGFSAATGSKTGVFAVYFVFMRYYPGREPPATITGHPPNENNNSSGGGSSSNKIIYDFEDDTASCDYRYGDLTCHINPSGFKVDARQIDRKSNVEISTISSYHGEKSLHVHIVINKWIDHVHLTITFPGPLKKFVYIHYIYTTSIPAVSGYSEIKGCRYDGWYSLAPFKQTDYWKKITLEHVEIYQYITIEIEIFFPQYSEEKEIDVWLDYIVYENI